MSQALLKRLRATTTPSDRVPAGWFTSAQWARKWGLSQGQTSEYLRAGRAQGVVACQKFRIPTGRGCLLVPHYREVTAPTKRQRKAAR